MPDRGTVVPTIETLSELERRVRALELRTKYAAPSGWIRVSDFPGGARRARRLQKAGKLELFRIPGGGRLLFVRVDDVDRLMEPVAVPEPEREPVGDVAPCDDGHDYATRNLRLLAGGSR